MSDLRHLVDAEVKAVILKALTPYAGKPMSPENVEAMTDDATEALVVFEKTQAEPVSRAQCRHCVEVGVEEMLRVVAREMAGEANAPGGDA